MLVAVVLYNKPVAEPEASVPLVVVKVPDAVIPMLLSVERAVPLIVAQELKPLTALPVTAPEVPPKLNPVAPPIVSDAAPVPVVRYLCVPFAS